MKSRIFITFIILLATVNRLSFAGDAPSSQIKRHAIVIGVNDPASTGRALLRYADDDAVNMYGLLRQAGADVTLLVELDENSRELHPEIVPDGAPTLDELLLEYEAIAQKMRLEQDRGYKTEFLLFYSGHGNIEAGEGYVVLESGKLSRSTLFEKILAPSPAHRNHVIVDACKSYFLVFDKGPGGERSPYLHPFAEEEEILKHNNTGFILSASSSRDSHEWERYQAGVFSHEVRSAFRGGADVDMDGKITYAELGAFLETANKSIPNPQFRPQFIVRPPGNPPGDLSSPILHWTDSENALLVDTGTLGHLYVENALGVRNLDVHPAQGQKLRLHLPPTRPMFIRKADDTVELSVSTLSGATLSTLSQQPIQIARKGALHLAFERLFDTPFDETHVRTYEQDYSILHAPTVTKQQKPEKSRTPRSIVRGAALWTAVGTAAGGLAMTLTAVGLKQKGEDASQENRYDINQDIKHLNIAAVVLYSIAGAAGATWLTQKLLPEDNSAALSLVPVAIPSGVILGVSGKFTP